MTVPLSQVAAVRLHYSRVVYAAYGHALSTQTRLLPQSNTSANTTPGGV